MTRPGPGGRLDTRILRGKLWVAVETEREPNAAPVGVSLALQNEAVLGKYVDLDIDLAARTISFTAYVRCVQTADHDSALLRFVDKFWQPGRGKPITQLRDLARLSDTDFAAARRAGVRHRRGPGGRQPAQ